MMTPWVSGPMLGGCSGEWEKQRDKDRDTGERETGDGPNDFAKGIIKCLCPKGLLNESGNESLIQHYNIR